MISVVIPVLNEEGRLRELLDCLDGMKGSFEVIVVDGGSMDGTREVASGRARVVECARGRAVQMNRGAELAARDVLFFLHADCLPEKEAFIEIEELMKEPGVVGGALRYDVADKSLLYRNHVFWSRLRARLTGIYLGDHGIFVRRSVFDRVGGFPPIPLMEDVALCRRLKEEGRLVQAKSRIWASTRRFKNQGFVRTVLQMWANRLLFWLGVPPERLARFYGDAR
ncbi:MAG: glycosyltransferase [Methanobacteriota archaeon]|nr:MAG: glycosyltransferase [Euryarchaeota archaeon]